MLDKFMGRNASRRAAPNVEALEPRYQPSATAVLTAGTLAVVGDAANDQLRISYDSAQDQIVVRSFQNEIARVQAAAVTALTVDAGAGNDVVKIDPNVAAPATVLGGAGRDILSGGAGATTLDGGADNDKLTAGAGATVFLPGAGANLLFNVKPIDTTSVGPLDGVSLALPVPTPAPAVTEVLTAYEVEKLLDRAAGATASNDAIIAIMDRGGRLLGVRVEGGVAPEITGNTGNLVFAVDGAMALARTGAFFGNAGAPITSRLVQFISQTTITQREVESNPNIPDLNSTVRGPGFVAPIGIKGHFPPNVPFTPQVDLFAIEHTNRDSLLHPGPDRIRGTADDIVLTERFNINPAFIPGSIPANQHLAAPESYGRLTGLLPNGQSRGIGTLPGGIPIVKNGQVVGGIGVFFPGKTGYATEENSALSAGYDPTRPDRALEAEYIAFAALGGTTASVPADSLPLFPIGNVAGIPPVQGIGLVQGRIDLVGITLDLFGPGGLNGTRQLVSYGRALGEGNPFSGGNLAVNGMGDTAVDGTPVPDGWLVTPHDGDGITASEVQQIIEDGISEAQKTRAAIRLPLNTPTAMVFAVADRQGEIVGLFRMPDATVFSIDVAVAKARNVAYYANPSLLQPADQLPGVAPGTALTNRSFRYLSLPRYPEGIEGAPPGPFSILNDGGVDPNTGLNVGAPLPASAYTSVQGFDAFNPGTNFRDPLNPANQNGIVFFPGSSPVYRGGSLLVGGFGVSGDGVDQDDVVTAGGAFGFEPTTVQRIDQVFVRGIRVPYQKFNRNPRGGVA